MYTLVVPLFSKEKNSPEAALVTAAVLAPVCSPQQSLDLQPLPPLSSANLTFLMKRFAAAAAATAAEPISSLGNTEALLSAAKLSPNNGGGGDEEEDEEEGGDVGIPSLLPSLELFSFGRREAAAANCFLYLAPATPPASDPEEYACSSGSSPPSSFAGTASPVSSYVSLSPSGDILSPPLSIGSATGHELSPHSPSLSVVGCHASPARGELSHSVSAAAVAVPSAPLGGPDNLLNLTMAIPQKPICSLAVLHHLKGNMNLSNDDEHANDHDDDDDVNDEDVVDEDMQSLFDSADDDQLLGEAKSVELSAGMEEEEAAPLLFSSLDQQDHNQNDTKKTISAQSSTKTIKADKLHSRSNNNNNNSSNLSSNYRLANSATSCWNNSVNNLADGCEAADLVNNSSSSSSFQRHSRKINSSSSFKNVTSTSQDNNSTIPKVPIRSAKEQYGCPVSTRTSSNRLATNNSCSSKSTLKQEVKAPVSFSQGR